MSNSKYLIIGGGGHAAAVAEILIKQNKLLIGVVSPKILTGHAIFDSLPHYSLDEEILKFSKDDVTLVNGIGAMPRKSLRERIFRRFTDLGYSFATVVADSAVVSEFCDLGHGSQIMNNAVVNIGSEIGANSIVNTGAVVEHDCTIGVHCHLAPGVLISGQTKIRNNVHIATGASVINDIIIGQNSIVGVGANVIKSVSAGTIVYGAKPTTKELGKENDN